MMEVVETIAPYVLIYIAAAYLHHKGGSCQ